MSCFVHGDSHNRLYRIYRGMLSRCYNTNQEEYKRYWGRGITVCDEWHNYLSFKEWALSHGYSDDLSIDRIDNSKGYSPNNCRWIPKSKQSSNQTTNVNITIDNETHTMSEWCRIFNISKDVVWHRIHNGWEPTKALVTPVNYNRKLISFNGKTKTIREWSETTGIPLNVLRLRFNNHWSVEKALTQPYELHNRRK